MQVHELRWFLAVVADPHLTRVAEAENVSQPALSRSLRRLEATTGVVLFDRVGRTLKVTAEGRRFAGRVAAALGELDAGFAEARAAGDPGRGEVHLGFLHTLGTWLVPDLVAASRSRHPAVELHLRQDAAEHMVDGLLEGRHDLILSSPDPGDARLRFRALFTEPLRLIVGPGHRLAGRGRIALQQVAAEPFIALAPGLGLRALADDLCAQAGFAPRIAFEGQEVETVRGLVRAGLGVAIVPARPGAPGPVDAETLALRDPGAERVVGLCTHRRRRRSAAADAFVALVVERASQLAGVAPGA